MTTRAFVIQRGELADTYNIHGVVKAPSPPTADTREYIDAMTEDLENNNRDVQEWLV